LNRHPHPARSLRFVKAREHVLTAIEVLCFAAVSLGVAVAGWAVAGPAGGAAAGLISGGAAGVYLVNAYSLPTEPEEEHDA